MANCGRLGAVLRRGRVSVLCALLVLGGVVLFQQDASRETVTRSSLSQTKGGSLLAGLPFAFEPNLGQSSRPVKFLARAPGYGLYLTSNQAVLTLGHGSKSAESRPIRMQFEGANSSSIRGVEPLPGHTNYFIGKDSSRWLHNVPQFARVRYDELYPGINLDFYGREGRLEYDFTVAPGTDPGQIALEFEGAEGMRIADNGDLVLGTTGGDMRFQAPHVYQRSDDREEAVSGRFILLSDRRAGFQIGAYDRGRELVIDPVLAFSTYLGGSGDESCAAIVGAQFVPHCPAIALDSASRVYIAGATTSTSGWPTPGAGPATIGPPGAADVFVARISNNGTALSLDYLTFLGGTGTDYPTGIGVDSGFNVYAAGNTGSSDFPTVNGLQNTAAGNHGFLTKLDASGSANLYSTYLAGSGIETVSDMILDTQARVYLIGTTTSATSPTFPTTPGALQPTFPAGVGNQFFFAKLDPSQTGAASLLYSTFFGGASGGGAMSGGAVEVDSNLNVYLAGGTTFTDIPVVNAFQGTLKAGVDVWAAKLKPPAGNTQQYSLVYQTYLGGSGDEVAYGVASDGTNTYITGSTTSLDITPPTGTTPFQAANGGATDAFVAKFGTPTTTGTTQGSVPLNYFTYLGGSGTDVGLAITVPAVLNTVQDASVAGFTTSGSGFPGLVPPLNVAGGGTDAFLARIATTSGSSATSLLGGSGSDIATSVATDVTLNTYLGGATNSGNFPTTSSPAPLQPGLAGNTDVFVTKLGPTVTGLTLTCPPSFNGTSVSTCNPVAGSVSPTPAGVGNNVAFVFPIYNTGDPVNGALFTASIQGTSFNATISSAAVGSGTGSCTVSSTTAVCNLGVINTSSFTTSTTTLAASATITLNVIATPPTPAFTGTRSIGVDGVLNVVGSQVQSTLGQQGQVNDFTVNASPASQTVTAGNQATYTITVTPTGPIPESVSLGSCSGLPAGAACAFSGNPIPNLNNLAQSRTLNITTTPRVTTPAGLVRGGSIYYALWLPLAGLAFAGMGVSRRRRWIAGVFIGCLLAFTIFEAGCSSYSSNTQSTTGTPAGTYTVTFNATSGSATRSTSVTLVVQ